MEQPRGQKTEGGTTQLARNEGARTLGSYSNAHLSPGPSIDASFESRDAPFRPNLAHSRFHRST